MADLLLSLSLLVTGIAANDQQLAVSADQLAVLADPFDTRSNLHGSQAPCVLGHTRSRGKRCYSSASTPIQGGGAKLASHLCIIPAGSGSPPPPSPRTPRPASARTCARRGRSASRPASPPSSGPASRPSPPSPCSPSAPPPALNHPLAGSLASAGRG